MLEFNCTLVQGMPRWQSGEHGAALLFPDYFFIQEKTAPD
jgi:hypothetical protein